MARSLFLKEWEPIRTCSRNEVAQPGLARDGEYAVRKGRCTVRDENDMKFKTEFLFFELVLTAMFICSCSKVPVDRPRPPILVPPVQSWPSNVLAAAETIKTSKVNSERFFAGEVIESFFMKHRLHPSTAGETIVQPLSRDAIIALLGPPDEDMSLGMMYDLGHYSGTSPFILFEIKNHVVVLTCKGHGDGPACTLHDHTKDFDFLEK